MSSPFRLLYRKRKFTIPIFLVLFFIWFFCLPKELFNDPQSTVIYSSDGQLLGATIAEDGQWRFPHSDTVCYKFRKAITEFEDRSFNSHWGISIKGLTRAFYDNLFRSRKSGGSTITMQLMRMSRKGKSRNIWQKFVEICWATRAEWRYSKDEIMALYASNAPMGGNVVGLEAASWRYFGQPSYKLTWAEASTLAILPNAPSLMHPGKNRDKLLVKRNQLLKRLYEIDEFDLTTYELSILEPLPDEPHPMPTFAPQLLTRIFKDGMKGQQVHTTLDLSIQQEVNKIVQRHHEQLKTNEINNASVLIMEVNSGEVIAYCGNVPELSKEHGSDVDIITAPRSTGSILKPFLYAAMLAEGSITPEMLIHDIPTVMSGYSPKNYNLKYDGMVPADVALAKSLNVPLVRMLTKFGVAKFQFVLNKLNFSTINKSPNHYGLSLILGGAEVNLWELVGAYGMMAYTLKNFPNKNYNRIPTIHYNKLVQDSITNNIIDPASCWFTFEAMKELARPEEDINWESFSTSQKIAWKTGTSFGFRDAWAVGVTPEYVVGVWVGNADGEGRPGLIGREAAAPLLFDIFSLLPKSDWFYKPFDAMKEVEICTKSGYRAGDYCENTKTGYIPKSSLKTTSCPYHELVYLDETENYLVNASCYDISKAIAKKWFNLPAEAAYYYRNHDPNYKEKPPFYPGCFSSEPERELSIIYPKNTSEIYIPINFQETREKIVLEATHKKSNVKLYWHLNEKFLGETIGIHQMQIQPDEGNYQLMILDELGNSASVTFKIVQSKTN